MGVHPQTFPFAVRVCILADALDGAISSRLYFKKFAGPFGRLRFRLEVINRIHCKRNKFELRGFPWSASWTT